MLKNDFERIARLRACDTRALVGQALADVVPDGYLLTINPERLSGDRLVGIVPVTEAVGSRRAFFSHSIHCEDAEAGSLHCRPTREFVGVQVEMRTPAGWQADDSIGLQGVYRATDLAACSDVASLVREVVSVVAGHAPFTSFEWRACPHDQAGTWELFNSGKRIQSVWRSGSTYGTLHGTCPATLREAKASAEKVARFAINCAHQERLAGLGDATVHDIEESEEAAPSLS